MTLSSINVTLGTAGHIDHGKTALVKNLTGCETDRLKEEKERGMSIDLGFAPCTIANLQVGIVDVPGHENFVKTMVAGASGMDGVVLVVAADDGIMPQTREHLDILTLLGIHHGLVALTKIDRIESDHLELAKAELEDYLRGTFLEAAPILPLSNITGEGFDAFYVALESLVRSIRPKRIDGVFRLPIERAFSVHGFGTVVAGIPTAGAARIGDEVELLPSNQPGRIKRIEVYGQASDTVLAGQCAAVNVGHWEHREISRGDVLATPGFFRPEEWFAARLRLLPRAKLNLKNGAQVRLHTGTAEVTAALYNVGGDRMAGGNDYLVQLRATTPIVAGPGDHFILRLPAPTHTIGGGVILEAVPGRFKRKHPEIAELLELRAAAVGDDTRFVEHCLRTAQSLAVSPTALSQETKLPPARLQAILATLEGGQKALSLEAGLVIHRETASQAAGQLLDIVRAYHAQSPESPGMTVEQLRQASSLEKAVLDGLVGLLKTAGRLAERDGRLAVPEHRATFLGDTAQQAATIEALFRSAAFQPPGVEEIVAKTTTPSNVVAKILKSLREQGRLVQVEDLLFHREAIDKARQILVEFLKKEGKLESVKFKYLLDTSRKNAIPLLDYFDRVGVTRRVGHTRFLK